MLQTCLMMWIWVSALACVTFVIQHILWQNFVSAQAQTLLGFWIQWVQVKGMLRNVGEGVVGVWPSMNKTRAENCWYKDSQIMKPKIPSYYMCYSTSANLFMIENTYIPFSCVWALKGALLYEVFQHRCGDWTWLSCLAIKVELRLLLPGCVQSIHTCETNTIIGRVILL